MNLELRHLRSLVAVDEARTFTDAAISLGTSQASELRVGYAWSALGGRTIALQRRWEEANPGVQLIWVQSGSPTAGLGGGSVDLAVVRRQLNDPRFTETLVGTERRYAAVAATDPLARRRFLRMADFAERTIAVDSRTGTTAENLWGPEAQPSSVRYVEGVDDWLTLIATGKAMGMSSEATAAQYPRPGVVYKVVRDAPPISVLLASWKDDLSVLIADFARLARQAFAETPPAENRGGHRA